MFFYGNTLYTLLHIVLTVTTARVTFDEISRLGPSCLNSCLIYNSRDSNNSLTSESCNCDNKCAEYRDCCLDAETLNQQPQDSPWHCISIDEGTGVFLKATCKPQWRGDQMIHNSCENTTSDVHYDPMRQLPVTNPNTGVSYRNYHCAICNDDTSYDMVLWKLLLKCPYLHLYNITRQNLTEKYIRDNLEYYDSQWGIWLDGDDENLHFYGCSIKLVVPDVLKSNIRSCVRNLISECSWNWNISNVREKCRYYTSVMYSQDKAYRNVHCALCNYVNTSELSCSKTEHEIVMYRNFFPNAFSMLLDVNEYSGTSVGIVILCRNGEVFDPFFKKCRNIVCGFSGYEPRNGKCVASEAQPSSTNDQNTVSTTTISETDNDCSTTNITHKNDCISSHQNKSGTRSGLSPTTTNQSILYGSDFLSCIKVSFDEGEYIFLNNQSIYIPKYDHVYNKSFYVVRKRSILVCADYLNRTSEQEKKFSIYMGYISLIGLGISIICLLLHFVVFLVIPDLHNFAGRNLLSLASALFCAYCCFIIGQLNILSPLKCTVVAILTYYFFLASFLWMNTLAFDVWRTLRIATQELRVSSGNKWPKFIGYSLYSWLSPVLLVIVAIIIEQLEYVPENYKPGFGIYHCWFGHKRALSLFFAAPLGLVMLANVILFVWSARMIVTTSSNITGNQMKSNRKNFRLYSRLALLMGLTWIIGLLAGYLDNEILWYVFIFLNTLQGLFIFIAFSCIPKVRTILQARFISVLPKVSTSRSQSINSGISSGLTSLTVVTSKQPSK
ncbi:uncharacterized protein LOC106464918 [Limulus polyphemus]|uniref:Uncharacterized protein LOC106464918 n=1 Tax=Limulus polyphemus TaxID=6850 RepID=A0ABM1SXS8_LIMPO|nr:uncharacterized protein LOC106464918 [Limulus polyphemus]XP_022248434.1 uncharacterized protein LOC106464918 [Limulus polyphemus]